MALIAAFRRYVRAVAIARWGYDFFISYSRKDGSPYAAALYDRLNRSFVVCFDREELLPGDVLAESLKRKVQRSQYLILIDTEGARASRYVAQEIQTVLAGSRRLIRINAPGRLTLRTPLAEPANVPAAYLQPNEATDLDAMISLDDPAGVTDAGVAPAVVEQILKCHTRRTILRQVARAAAAAAAAVALITVAAVSYAWGVRLGQKATALSPDTASFRTYLSDARALAREADVAATVRLPFLLQRSLEPAMRASLARANRTRIGRIGTVRAVPGADSVLLSSDGTGLFWRSDAGIVLSPRVEDVGARSEALAPKDGLRLWRADLDQGRPIVALAYGDRFETHTLVGGRWEAVSVCPHGGSSTSAVALTPYSGALVIGGELRVIALATCATTVVGRGFSPAGINDLTFMDSGPGGEVLAFADRQASCASNGATLTIVGAPAGEGTAPRQLPFPLPGGVGVRAYHEDKGLLAIGSGSRVLVYDLGSRGAKPRDLDPGACPTRLEFSRDGALLAVSTEEQNESTVRVFRLANPRPIAEAGVTLELERLTPAVFSGSRTLVYVENRPDRGEHTLRSLVVPESVVLAPTLSKRSGGPAALYARGATVAVAYDDGAVELFARADDAADVTLSPPPPADSRGEPARLPAMLDEAILGPTTPDRVRDTVTIHDDGTYTVTYRPKLAPGLFFRGRVSVRAPMTFGAMADALGARLEGWK